MTLKLRCFWGLTRRMLSVWTVLHLVWGLTQNSISPPDILWCCRWKHCLFWQWASGRLHPFVFSEAQQHGFPQTTWLQLLVTSSGREHFLIRANLSVFSLHWVRGQFCVYRILQKGLRSYEHNPLCWGLLLCYSYLPVGPWNWHYQTVTREPSFLF
jgi:hypothetical protein